MGIQYRKAKMVLNYRESKPEVYKMRQITYPTVTSDQLVQEISQSQGINTGTTKAVIDALTNRIVHYMSLGHGVSMGGFGSFKPIFTSKVAQSLEDTTLETLKKKKIQFTPHKALQDMLSNLSITEAEILSLQPEDDDNNG